ncbi:enoyl-CoA hydratase/isomerase family protein [Nocardioides carbamazepini]|uniref:enoyl-CoA hydratase/isomerase family protein n=1 Tax=Nocardioides carbamazepini TaxID=2854259 RepID=UPI002149D6A4|nr:enoyl-CoA hydratase/isomerase family protein [Nocardioides carbamazepini]MCR1785047.1 enoyl-CoA hydratase/isomerase family protein [Nocardioides carbamazepini]
MTTPGIALDDLRHDHGPVRVELHGPDDAIALVTLHRPEVANALDDETMAVLADLWTRAAACRELRCIVITGAGKAFCSGADASMLSAERTVLGDTAAAEMRFVAGTRVGVPVITLVNGACAGGGLHFVADADICIASTAAWFTDPHVSVGQVSALEPLLLRLRMRSDALTRLALLGRAERLDAERAEQVGLVSEVVAPADLLARGLELATAISQASPEAVRLTRRALRTFEDRLLETHLDLGWELIRRHRAHPDATEGPRAFLERRSPHWATD